MFSGIFEGADEAARGDKRSNSAHDGAVESLSPRRSSVYHWWFTLPFALLLVVLPRHAWAMSAPEPPRDALQVIVKGALRAPPVGAREVLVLQVTLQPGADSQRSLVCDDLRISALRMDAFRKPGDPTRLTVRSMETAAALAQVDLSSDRTVYEQSDGAFALPRSCTFGVWASTEENWARLVSRRKLSRLVRLTVQSSDDNTLPVSFVAKKRPRGREHADDANVEPSRLSEIIPGAAPTSKPNRWRLPAGQYSVDDDVVIPRGAVLQIDPGVTVRLAVGRSIVSYGRIQAKGTERQPIVFRSRGEAAFGAIALIGYGANGSVFEHVRFERGSQAWSGLDDLLGTLDIRDTKASVRHCSFFQTRGEDALHVLRGDVEVHDVQFSEIASDAVDYDSAVGRLTSVHFTQVGDDAIDAGKARLSVEDAQVTDAGGKGVSAGTDSQVTLKNVRLIEVGRGVSAFDGAEVRATELTIVRAKRGPLQALHRRKEKAGRIQVQRLTLWENLGEIEGQAEGRVVLSEVTDTVPVEVDSNRSLASSSGPTQGRVQSSLVDLFWLLGALLVSSVLLLMNYRARLRASHQ